MPMFGDLNKLNTQQEKQQREKKSSSVVPAIPIENKQVQNRIQSPSPSAVDTTPSRRDAYRNEPANGAQGTRQSDETHVLSPSQQPVNQSVDQSTSRSTDQSTSQLTEQSSYMRSNKIVGRPKAFYITERLDTRLDDAVKYLQEQHSIRKVDRSTIVNALLDNEANWTEENLELLVSRVLSLLTSRLTS
jgi:hypothetical protein